MKTSSLFLVPCLALALVACGESEPEYTRPPEYRNEAAEYLLSMQAQKDQVRRNKRERLIWMRENQKLLTEIPSDFPLAFTTFPGAEMRTAFSSPPLTMVSLTVAEPPTAAFERIQKAAEVDGWTLEMVADANGGPQASFQKDSRRVEVRVTPNESGAEVVSLLTDLAATDLPPPAAPAP